jgi:AT-rich interactive domain-containing protein 1
MALKSGLLAESTWALDVLSVLLYDDHTVAYFGLAHMPGLLEVLCEHLRRVLIDTFGGPFLEQEILSSGGAGGAAGATELTTPAPGETERDRAECERVLRNAPFHVAEEWAGFTGVASSSLDWQQGHGDTTRHVVTHMDSDDAHQFYRQRFRKRPATTSVDEARASSERVAIVVESEEEEEEEEEEQEGELNTSRSSLLNESGAEVKDLITSIECNEMDKKRLERLKRKMERGDEESESYERNAPPLCLMTDAQGELARRCVCISNILRNLSFIPGNDREMSRHHGLLSLAGQLLLLHHRHPKRRRMPKQHAAPPPPPADTAADTADTATAALVPAPATIDPADDDTCIGGGGNKDEWWWETLEALRENALVIFSNISGHIKMAELSEEICFPVLDGLLHWSVCPSAYAQDPLPGLPPSSVLSPQRLVLEALCKLCVTDTNVDLLLATPPFSRLVQLFACLVRQLDDTNDQVLREFSIVLLSSLVAGDSSAARAVALTHPAISQLLHFVEVAEANASKLASTGQIRMLQEHPEMMGTSMDMLRRAAAALTHLSAIHENRSLFLPHQPRLLALVMSSVLDNQVISSLSTVLFNCTSHESTDYEHADHS